MTELTKDFIKECFDLYCKHHECYPNCIYEFYDYVRFQIDLRITTLDTFNLCKEVYEEMI